MIAVSANVPRSLVTTKSELNQPTLHTVVACGGLVHTRTDGSGAVFRFPVFSAPSISAPSQSRIFCKRKSAQQPQRAIGLVLSRWRPMPLGTPPWDGRKKPTQSQEVIFPSNGGGYTYVAKGKTGTSYFRSVSEVLCIYFPCFVSEDYGIGS